MEQKVKAEFWLVKFVIDLKKTTIYKKKIRFITNSFCKDIIQNSIY